MKAFFFLFSGCIAVAAATAQSKTCTQGCAPTTVLLFDFNVKVDTAATDPGLRHQLFYLAPALRKRLTARAFCLELLDGNEVKQPEDVFPEDATIPNVYVPGDDAYHLGEYLLTGTVNGSGGSFTVSMTMETSISRKTIKSVQVPVDLNGRNSYQAAAEKLEAALGSLETCIKEYEIRERETNLKIAFGQPISRDADPPQLLVVKPKKTKLQMGEETEVEITLKDCDGYPLKNRTISFTGELYDSSWRKGTYGGTVTPLKVVTDAQGKAKVTFKAGKAYAFAAIVAHYRFEQPCGRKDVITGSAAIDMQLKPYRVIAYYTSSVLTKVNSRTHTSEYTESSTGNERSKAGYMMEFYYAPLEQQDGLSVNSLDSSVAKIYIVQEKGSSSGFGASSYTRRFHSGETIHYTNLFNTQGILPADEAPR